jgi:lipocalin-like protein
MEGMMRTAPLVLVIGLQSIPAVAGEEELYGTWQLASMQRRIVDTGQTLDAFGPDPRGFLMYGEGGRMMVLIAMSSRPKPDSIEKMTDQQRADLFRSTVAYAGTYTFDGKRVEHHVDVAWNEVWNGTLIKLDAVRNGNRLTYTTAPIPFAGDGKISVVTLSWDKLK